MNLQSNYYVEYTYRELSYDKTELEYFEYVEKWNLENPFTLDILKKLKEVIEKFAIDYNK